MKNEDLGMDAKDPNELTFQSELTNLINKYSEESNSNTPDWILAEYIVNCLYAFNRATQTRTTWYSVQEGDDVGHVETNK